MNTFVIIICVVTLIISFITIMHANKNRVKFEPAQLVESSTPSNAIIMAGINYRQAVNGSNALYLILQNKRLLEIFSESEQRDIDKLFKSLIDACISLETSAKCNPEKIA